MSNKMSEYLYTVNYKNVDIYQYCIENNAAASLIFIYKATRTSSALLYISNEVHKIHNEIKILEQCNVTETTKEKPG